MAIRQLHRDHLSGRHDNHKILFSLIVLEEWLRHNDRGTAWTTPASAA
jgi:asparagine synthase (glutamine-hydrolysing)